MSLFQCESCGCCENTALSAQGFKMMKHLFNWNYKPELEGRLICSACGPSEYKCGAKTKFGKWHDVFERTYLEKGKFFTNDRGDLEHTDTGRTDIENMRISNED